MQVESVVAVAAETDEDEVEIDGDGEVGLGLDAVEGREIAGLYPVLGQRLVRALCGFLKLFLAAERKSGLAWEECVTNMDPNLQANDFLNGEVGKANRAR